MTYAPARSTPAQHVDWLTIAQHILLTGFLLLTFVGTSPFAERTLAARVEGDPLDRWLVFGLLAVALPVILVRRRVAYERLCASKLLFLVIGFCQISVIWSDYPGLTLRRALLFAFLAIIATAIATGVTSLRRFHSFVFVILTGVILLNLAGTLLWPEVAISDIGVQGLYSQKNVAGLVAMLTLIIGASWIMAAPAPGAVLGGLAALVPTLIFLILTRSKTSIALAALALLIGLVFVAAQRLGKRFAILALSATILALATLIGILVVQDFSIARTIGVFLQDTSFTGRDELWAFAWHSALDKPWLGHGYGAFWDVGAVNDPLARQEVGTWLGDVEKGVINQAHNGYLELSLHIGLPATVVAVAAVVTGLYGATRCAISSALPGGDRAACGAIALVMLLYLLHNMTEATLFMRGSQFCNLALLLQMLIPRLQIPRLGSAAARAQTRAPTLYRI